MTEENGEEPAVLPPTYLVLQLNPDTPSSALKWLVDKIKGQRRDGGAELVLLKQPTRDNEVNSIQIEYNFHFRTQCVLAESKLTLAGDMQNNIRENKDNVEKLFIDCEIFPILHV